MNCVVLKFSIQEKLKNHTEMVIYERYTTGQAMTIHQKTRPANDMWGRAATGSACHRHVCITYRSPLLYTTQVMYSPGFCWMVWSISEGVCGAPTPELYKEAM